MEWPRTLMKSLQPLCELLTAAERDAIVALHLNEHLLPLGLTPVGSRAWVDRSGTQAKRMFELALLKGAGMRARWGFSLDFVPHISGGRVRWHRSENTAMLDVIIDPSKNVLLEPTSILGAARLHDDLDRLLPAAVEKAKETWRRGVTERGLLELVREIRERQTNYLPFDVYTQLPLTYVLLSAKLGDLAVAERELDHYISRLKVDDDVAAKLKQLAREYAGNAAAVE
jgi:hypothetical protein